MADIFTLAKSELEDAPEWLLSDNKAKVFMNVTGAHKVGTEMCDGSPEKQLPVGSVIELTRIRSDDNSARFWYKGNVNNGIVEFKPEDAPLGVYTTYGSDSNQLPVRHLVAPDVYVPLVGEECIVVANPTSCESTSLARIERQKQTVEPSTVFSGTPDELKHAVVQEGYRGVCLGHCERSLSGTAMFKGRLMKRYQQTVVLTSPHADQVYLVPLVNVAAIKPTEAGECTCSLTVLMSQGCICGSIVRKSEACVF